MCCAASFSMVSASSWSLIEGSEIFFTITECPLTAVATALVLIWLSRNSLEIALETVPESTIIESTTMSEDSGSRPRCATSICPPFLFNSTALMLEEPTSSARMVFDPNPNMCPPLLCPGSFHRRLGFAFRLRFHLARLLFHPLVQPRFLETPAVAQLECGNLLLRSDPAAFIAALGLRFACGSIWLDFSSIHWSSRDFLKRQRLPSLNAGIFCSPTYL